MTMRNTRLWILQFEIRKRIIERAGSKRRPNLERQSWRGRSWNWRSSRISTREFYPLFPQYFPHFLFIFPLRLRKFKKEIKKVEESVEVKQENRHERNEQKKFGAGRLGKLRFQEEEFPIKESVDELGNLRKLEPEGNILVDRFKSMQKRKMLAPNRKRPIRKRAVVKIKKRSFKEETPITVPKFKWVLPFFLTPPALISPLSMISPTYFSFYSSFPFITPSFSFF